MNIEQCYWNKTDGWEKTRQVNTVTAPQLVLYFGSLKAFRSSEPYEYLKEKYPDAQHVGCTTAGEIIEDEVYDDTIVVSAIEFADTPISVATTKLSPEIDSHKAGMHLGNELRRDDLRGVMLISDGTRVNGSELVRGIVSVLGNDIPITGGLAGDGGQFETTLVSCNCQPDSGRIAAIGFYGTAISIGHGSVGGWDPFGPERKITKSKGNVLYELDGQPALDLYKMYLGEQADQLPGSALLFPLMIRSTENSEVGLVRTILSVDESDQSMVFAGDIPEGYCAQLMRANFERLIDGAGEAAGFASIQDERGSKLAVLISCVGRKMVLGQRTAEEVEAVQTILGKDCHQIGFYSYGEISPHVPLGSCELHNQTMTVTTLSEN